MTSISLLPAVEVQTGPAPTAALIAIHGIGADCHYFEPLLSQLAPFSATSLRFVLPQAPIRPVTLSGGELLRAWYDIRSADRQLLQDGEAIRASSAAIGELIDREQRRGIPSERVVLAGFSQGGAMALFTGTRFPRRLAGIVALSGYQLLADSFAAERQSANQATPIFLAHGRADPVIDIHLADLTRERLEQAGYAVESHLYDIGHELIAAELAAVASFVQRVLSPAKVR